METQETFAAEETIGKRLIDNIQQLKLYAFRLTGDAEHADDLLQETSVKVLCNVGNFVYNSNLGGWAATIMHNIYVNECTRSACCVAVADDAFLDGEYYDCHVDTEEITRVMETLPIEHRIVFRMFADGYKYAEISEKLNIPLGTVKSRIHTARTRLQELLRGYME